MNPLNNLRIAHVPGVRVAVMGRALAVTLGLLVLPDSWCGATTYYVHPRVGNDASPGTSVQTPWRTLERASTAKLREGDQLLLAAGQTFPGQLAYEGLAGSALNPIVISSYGDPNVTGHLRPIIDARGWIAGVHLRNSQHIEIRDLLITADAGGLDPRLPANTAMRCGVLVEVDKPGDYAGYCVTNLMVKDVFFESPGFTRDAEEVRSANGTQRYGWGIRFLVTSPGATVRDIAIVDCQITNVSHTGLKLTASSNGLQNVRVQRVQITDPGGPGVQMSGVRGGHFSQLDVNRSGSTNDSRKWGRGSGLWTWGSSEVVIEKSQFQNANGPGDSAGVHIDFNCRNIIVQYNLSANNAGGFCEILGNNYNCAYRYNVSINDGHRVKGKGGAFQEGKTFWLSGYTGDKSARQGPFNSYFYNNTIYVDKDIVAKFAVAPTTRGLFIANNIFYIMGRSEAVQGDQNKVDHGRAVPCEEVVFENNLYLAAGNWPPQLLLQDQSPFVGNPAFQKAGGPELADYIPGNAALVKDKGINILKLPHDNLGLFGGLKVQADILGNRIHGLPDLGAIELTEKVATSEK